MSDATDKFGIRPGVMSPTEIRDTEQRANASLRLAKEGARGNPRLAPLTRQLITDDPTKPHGFHSTEVHRRSR